MQTGISTLPAQSTETYKTSAVNTAEIIAAIPGSEESFDVLEETFQQTDEPPQFVVYLLNDDYTTFDFVVKVLVSIFKKTIEDAIRITNDVHHNGRGACGIYTRQIAETKIAMVEDASQQAGFPLRCIMEEA